MIYRDFITEFKNICSKMLLQNTNKRSIILLPDRTCNDETLIDMGAEYIWMKMKEERRMKIWTIALK